MLTDITSSQIQQKQFLEFQSMQGCHRLFEATMLSSLGNFSTYHVPKSLFFP